MTDSSISFATGPMWAGFIVFVLAMLALDLFVFGGRKAHKVSVKEAGAWVAVWVSLALAFAYFFFVVLAEMLRDNTALHPYLLLWVPNALFIGVGAWLLMRLDYR